MAQSFEYQRYWYPYAMLTEEERTHEMLEMLRPYIACAIKDSDELPTTKIDHFGRVLHAKHRLAQKQEEEAKVNKVREQKGKRKDNPLKPRSTLLQGKKKRLVTILACKRCGRNYQGECKNVINICSKNGKEGHFV